MRLGELVAIWFVMAVGCASERPVLVYSPPEYRGPELAKSPTGEPESIRYERAYAAYWWNCVFVRAESIDARCPFMCSGTPGASAGCSDGGMAAANAIDELTERFDTETVQIYLQGLTESRGAKVMIQPYFGGKPRVERGPDDMVP
jgi:hypothetical protein